MPDMILRFRAGGRTQTITIPILTGSFRGTYNAELPRTRFESPYVARTGTIRNVPSGGNLQAALDDALPGDSVVLEANATFVGNYVAPTNKSGGVGGDIYVEDAAVRAGTATPSGTRKTSDAGCATIRHPGTNASPLLSTSGNGRTGWRFAGIRMDVPSDYTGTSISRLVQLGDPSVTTVSGYPGRFVFDRCRLFGRPLAEVRRGIWVTGPDCLIIDSVIEDFVSRFAGGVGDSQGVLISNAASNVLIRNTGIGGSSESVMVGGLDSNVIPDTSVIPFDITVERGHHYCMPYQDPTDPAWNGIEFNLKNFWECKGGNRLLFQDMQLTRHIGKDGQYAIVPKGGGQAGQAIAAASDIVIRNIRLVNCEAGVFIKGFSAPGGPNAIERVFVDNVALFKSKPTTTIIPRMLAVTDYADRIEFSRITALLTGANAGISYIQTDSVDVAGRLSNIRLTNSILGAPSYGMQIAGDIDKGMSDLVGGDRIITGCVLVGRPSAEYSSFNTGGAYPTNAAAVGFTSYADSETDNLLLSSSSPYKGTGPGGADPGCDIPALLAATAGCVSGVWS